MCLLTDWKAIDVGVLTLVILTLLSLETMRESVLSFWIKEGWSVFNEAPLSKRSSTHRLGQGLVVEERG